MRTFEYPEINVKNFQVEDVISASVEHDNMTDLH